MRAPCGSSRCTCDHSICDVGWFRVVQRHPVTGESVEAFTKCLACFVPPEPVEADPLGRATRKKFAHDARDLGAEYPDHAAAAAGDKP